MFRPDLTGLAKRAIGTKMAPQAALQNIADVMDRSLRRGPSAGLRKFSLESERPRTAS